MAEVDGVLDRVLDDVAALLAEATDHDTDPARATPGPLVVDLVDELRERVHHPGKRLRPLVAHLGWSAAGGDDATRGRLVEVAAALELLHLFALIQDDVMDRSAARRGRPTLHVVGAERHRERGGLGDPELFGDSVATLVSDLALSEATLLAATGGPRVARTWRLMAAELVEGQLLDVSHTAGRGRDLTTSMRIARAKSSRYTIGRPLQLGALVAGADDDLVARLLSWGDLVGDAFAVRDDVLGVWGDPTLTGKPAGDDLRSGKPTALLVWAAEMLPDSERFLLERCDAGRLDDLDVARLQRAMEEAGVYRRAEALLRDLLEQADEVLADLDPDERTAASLRGLAETVAWRDR
ncbi:polyprenyl synthetase family protein [Phycicoccus sp. BSK3Z-2]|uniref:Polyprenyl synthetase family protein n=1 Tax=Phycicoccus avicenniae TaxID=2828860 RepID=A0A941I0D9_9MICO|nr:polyprenyl synthetase family protein [Phycicoccus avicenniae]MBR7743992.1 polyprenyl synthetase family protein [Phycicoccus avicenniae]